MRATDIEIGTEYAYKWRQWSTPVRVKVIEKAMVSGGSFHEDIPGWLLEVIEQPPGERQYPVGKRFKAKSRQVDSTWADWVQRKAVLDANARQQEELQAQRDAANSIALAELQAFYIERGLDTTNLSTGTMRFKPSQLLALVKAVDNHANSPF